jgi:hypothetical protein
MNSREILLALVMLTSVTTVAGEFTPLVIVYDGNMPELAEGVASILASTSNDGEEFLVLSDPFRAASMLSLPNVRCLVLTSTNSNDLVLLREPVIAYFRNGGSAIGFHGCCWQNTLGDLARLVFPVYGNSTVIGQRKSGLSVNEYTRDARLGGIGDSLPDNFDLVGQFFAAPKDSVKNLVEPVPTEGEKTVLYRDRSTGTPLVIAYQGDGGGRSIAFSGFFVRNNPATGNHYEKLLTQPEFSALLLDCYKWASGGNSRFNGYWETYEEVIEEGIAEREDLVNRAEERESSRRNQRTLLLVAFWALGILAIAGLSYWAFVLKSP